MTIPFARENPKIFLAFTISSEALEVASPMELPLPNLDVHSLSKAEIE